jgi:CheY-like chemotaxis protein
MFNCKKLAVLLFAVCLPLTAFASTGEQLQLATSEGNVAFVLVTQPGAVGMEQARQTIQDALKQIPGSVMMESNRTDAANSAFVQQYKLAAAPVPLILVFASNGAMAGGNVSSKLSAKKLVAMVPSPKKAEVLRAIQSGQAVYLTASRSGMEATSDIAKGCAAACSQMQGKCVSIDVNMDDPVEKGLLNQLKVNTKSTEPVTVVINAKGQITGSYTGMVEVENLIASATKVVASGCCPPGSGKSCGPAPKKEGK